MRGRRRRVSIPMALTLALSVAACASTGGGTARPEGATGNRIVRAELVEQAQLNALQAVQRLRGQWLQSRAGTTGGAAVLYVDGAPRGTADDLRYLRADEIDHIDYMSGNDATTRYGSGHTGGAILVFLLH